MRLLKDAGHLVRFAVLLAIGVIAFLIVRAQIIPKNFGEYGHYRPAVLEEMRARPVKFAGRAACQDCHTDQMAVKQAGKHAGLSCEACHGPQAAHAEDPSAKPKLPDIVPLCSRCHEANSAKPKAFPQVITKEHSAGESCATCHKPHNPKVGA